MSTELNDDEVAFLKNVEAENSRSAKEIARLQKIEQAALNLIAVKGRHHSEIAMRLLMKACES